MEFLVYARRGYKPRLPGLGKTYNLNYLFFPTLPFNCPHTPLPSPVLFARPIFATVSV